MSVTCKVLVPTGALGLGFPDLALERGIALRPNCIAVDAGSTDSGAYYLGTGTSKMTLAATERDLDRLMRARGALEVPLLIGSCGTCGTDSGVDWMAGIAANIAEREHLAVRVELIYAEQCVEAICALEAAGAISPLAPSAPLSGDRLRECRHIVALLGAEPLIDAIGTRAQIVLAGRTTDTAVIAAAALAKGCSAAAAWHGAKIAECGGLCTTHSQLGGVMLTIDETGFEVEPLHPDSRCTPYTVSGHLLYENADPYRLKEPGLILDTSGARYEALDDRRVRVTGSRIERVPYTLKLEGAGPVGWRTMIFIAIADPHVLAAYDVWQSRLEAELHHAIGDLLQLDRSDYLLDLRPYGWNALGLHTTAQAAAPREVGLMLLISAATQARAREIARLCNPILLHFPLDAADPMPSFAFPFSPAEVDLGPHFEFKLNHVVSTSDPSAFWRTSTLRIGAVS